MTCRCRDNTLAGWPWRASSDTDLPELKRGTPTGINVETIVVSVIGAIIVIFVMGLLGGRRRGSV